MRGGRFEIGIHHSDVVVGEGSGRAQSARRDVGWPKWLETAQTSARLAVVLIDNTECVAGQIGIDCGREREGVHAIVADPVIPTDRGAAAFERIPGESDGWPQGVEIAAVQRALHKLKVVAGRSANGDRLV